MTTGAFTLATAVGVVERPILVAAAQQLSAAVGTALGRDWPVRIVLAEPDDGEASGSIWFASLIDEVPRSEPIEATAARWLERIDRRPRAAGPRILLATLFRKAGPDGAGLERLRRLNMMALALSRTAGIEIVDIDRIFAWCGARTLRTDYRCLGERAAAVGGHAIAAAVLAGDLDDVLPAEVQEKAAGLHGGVQNVATILKRRIPRS